MRNDPWLKCLGLVSIFLATCATARGQSLGDAVDAPTLNWTTYGWMGAYWFPQTNVSHDGLSAAQGQSLPPGTYTIIETTIEGPATVTFWWKALRARVDCNVAGVQ